MIFRLCVMLDQGTLILQVLCLINLNFYFRKIVHLVSKQTNNQLFNLKWYLVLNGSWYRTSLWGDDYKILNFDW